MFIDTDRQLRKLSIYKPMNYIDDRLVGIIDNLTAAVNVCYKVENATLEEMKNDRDLSYPFSTGYSRSAMNRAIDHLNVIVKELREESGDDARQSCGV